VRCFLSERETGKKLLYDPMFAHKPDVNLEHVSNIKMKKAIFIVVISIFVGISLFMSFSSLGSEKYEYEENDNGYLFSSFNGKAEAKVLEIDKVFNEYGTKDNSKSVTAVRKFALCCNEYLEFIYIGKDVETLENHCFYYCKNLKAVFVDPENPNYTSVDGVLYNKDMTKIILCPARHAEYAAAIKLGAPVPLTADKTDAYFASHSKTIGSDATLSEDEIKVRNELIQKNGGDYEIAATVTEICDSAFSDCENLVSVKIPNGVKTIGQLAFFKCYSLKKADIPDGVEEIKSDGFSYCESLTYIFVPKSVKTIGHHAFFGCMGIENLSMEADSLDGIKTGEEWLPKKDVRSLKAKDVLFSQERSDG